MGAITLIPALFTAAISMTAGFRRSVVYVGIPALVLLPNYYTWSLPGLPDASFHNYLLLALGIGLFVSSDRALYRFHWIDSVPLLLIMVMAASQFQAEGLAATRNLVASQTLLVIVPWILGRAIANHNGLLCGVLASLLYCGAFIGLVAPIEARLGMNPFDFLRSSWPGHVPWEGALYRLGIRRTSGPLAHPICLGFFYTMIIPAGLWLVQSKAIPRRVGVICVVFCSMGLLLTVSRGPLLSMGVILLLMGIMTFVRCPRLRAFSLVLSVIAIFGIATALVTYASIEHDEAKNSAQESAAYRMKMVDNYMPLLLERPWMGYGKDHVPVVDNQKSIDNQFLLMALQFGLPASLLNLMFLVAPMIMLILALWQPLGTVEIRNAGKMLVTLLLAATITQLTVFSGPQTAQILLLFTGASVTLAARIRTPQVAYSERRYRVRLFP